MLYTQIFLIALLNRSKEWLNRISCASKNQFLRLAMSWLTYCWHMTNRPKRKKWKVIMTAGRIVGGLLLRLLYVLSVFLPADGKNTCLFGKHDTLPNLSLINVAGCSGRKASRSRFAHIFGSFLFRFIGRLRENTAAADFSFGR